MIGNRSGIITRGLMLATNFSDRARFFHPEAYPLDVSRFTDARREGRDTPLRPGHSGLPEEGEGHDRRRGRHATRRRPRTGAGSKN